VLDFSANETADVLEITVSSANSALHRARVTLAKRYRKQGVESAVSSITDARTQWLLDHFVQAWESADVEGLVALLKEDAILAMPPSPSWYQGRETIAVFVAATVFATGGMFGGKASGRWRLIPTQASASPGFGLYLRTAPDQYQAFGIQVLSYQSGQLTQIMDFLDPSLPSRFGLPVTLGNR
jgi:RNA polymerase sigma-70 factor (ECF subfamily)